MTDLSPRVAARVLGHGLILAPSEEGRSALTRDINECDSDPELLAGLAHLYVYGLIRVFYNPKGRTPAISATQSPRLSFELAVQNLEHLLQQPSITARDLRQLTLFRDNNRCIFTGSLDLVVAKSHGVPKEKCAVTRSAHIISQSLSSDIEGLTPAVLAKFRWGKMAGAMIERFGGFSSHDVLGDNILNSPLNAFTATASPHEEFDGLDMWLTPVNDEHGDVISDTYDVVHYLGNEWLHYMEASVMPRVIFRHAQLDSRIIPAPHPRIISLHAACARIAHMSGAAEHLKEFFRDPDEISVMTGPSAAHELTRILRKLQVVSPIT